MNGGSEHKNMECGDASQTPGGSKCCQVDALITIDGRGQLVLPKEVREKAEIKAGDKFLLMSYESKGKVCCIFLVKADDFGETVKGMLGPMMQDILQ